MSPTLNKKNEGKLVEMSLNISVIKSNTNRLNSLIERLSNL